MRVPIRLPAHSKYKAKRTNGYASKREADYAEKLLLWLKIGEIRNFKEQVRFILVPKDELGADVVYIADFTFIDKCGYHVIDVKGFKTPVYRLKRRLMWQIHGLKIEEV